MTRATPPTTFLKNYSPFPYDIQSVRLAFDLDDTATRVSSELRIARTATTPPGTPLELDGEKLELQAIAIDGVPLATPDYCLAGDKLTICSPPGKAFTLSLVSICNPRQNTELSGLYLSNGMYCTQCEAEGFRRITFFPDRPDVMAAFEVRIEAPITLPVLLSNGNPQAAGPLPGGQRHFAEWHDPFPKPSYLFALVAGDLDRLEDRFTTMDGSVVGLAIHVEKGKTESCRFAMEALKRAMRWDEERFGRAYDLDVFNIVAVPHFNMGAMENKGLNIFNDRYVLADPGTATDTDYANVEAIVAHEYFHNWTGNRITCRDWFQLCLKEGLTVYRDQEFTADVRSRPIKRITDVRTLRARQFPEDGGPLAHPVRPDRYIEINNFYTPTVYEKGAEICRMLALLVGEAAFRAGMDLYFARHDGEAVTIEAFLACFAEAAGRDLGQFHRWYTQAGTPQIVAEGQHDPASKTYTLTVTQRTPPTPGQEAKQPLHIPLRVGLIGGNGEDMTLACDEARGDVLELTAPMQTFRFRNVAQRPVLSLNRGFSAPALLTTNATPEDELFAMAHDSDSFNRWQAGQSRGLALLTARYGGTVRPAALQAYSRALAQAATDPKLEQAFRGLLLTLPTEADMAAAIGREVSAPQVKATRDAVRTDLATLLLPELKALWAETAEAAHGYRPDAAGAGRRALRYAVLPLLLLADPAAGEDLARGDFTTTPHLTARMGVLQALVQATLPFRNEALAHFRDGAGNDPLLIDKWFMLQAQAGDGAAVQALLAHADFTYLVPNRVHALVSTFMAANPAAFHASDGTGYVAVADAVIASDRINPQLAARVATGFRSWRMFDASARRHAEAELGRILGQRHLSRDCYEIVSRIMQAP